MRNLHGPHYWLQQTLEGVDADKIVIDGVRNLGEIKWLRDEYPKSFVAAVITMRDTRWDRLKAFPDYSGNESNFDRDDKMDWDLEEKNEFGQQVQKCVLAADFVLRTTIRLERQ